jgi:capsular polysaccharide transport system permease protein
LQLAEFIISESESMINEITDRMVAMQTQLARRELESNEKRLQSSREALLDFRVDNAILDPENESGAKFGNIAALDSQLTEKRTTLRAKESYLRDDAFDLKVLRQEIAALEAQRGEEMRRFATGSEDQSMAGIVKKYEALKIEHEFALGAYTTALTMVESATLEAAKQEKFLLPIAEPHLPEKPVFPRPVRGTVLVFILALAFLGIGRLVVATIRDHTV